MTTELALGFCRVCTRVRKLAELESSFPNQGVCTQCVREQQEADRRERFWRTQDEWPLEKRLEWLKANPDQPAPWLA